MTEGQNRAPAQYWPRLEIDGEHISLLHLEPFQVDCNVHKLQRILRIDVRFSNHCFTDHFDAGTHDSSWKIMDHTATRVFCRSRYRLSAHLPRMVRSLPTAAVWQTRQERNYVHFIQIEDEAGDRYPMFFTLKKVKGAPHQLAMMVESAYAVAKDAMDETIRTSNKVSFPVLCGKVFQGQPLRFNARR
ncbi:hypothetical protein VSX64_22925 [Aurantimonas sp. C2-6-R+9]|uniref:hypothetical protein n=1 Tax=unclassified Aurantimonas TaxID=2638230 RepID=UPI002E17EAD4|nr:hypothetical protein [Aurantimonas sp. C2-6-R+9]